jgi:putative tryptophan/tyrosine transport system substrate-binding protein
VRRRDFITSSTAAMVSWPVRIRAQSSSRVFRIGYVGLTRADDLPERLRAFRAGLEQLGYTEGRDVVISPRWADGRYERLPALFAELVDASVDVIVTHGTPGVLAAKQATSTIPIVIAVVGDAVGAGLVPSLAGAGGNVTGLTFFQPELAAKRLEMLKEAVPRLTRSAVLLNSANPMNVPALPAVVRVSQSLGIALEQFEVRDAAGVEPALAAISAQRIGGVVLFDDAVLLSRSAAIAGLASSQALPSSGWPDFARDGGLIGYGVDFPEMYRRAAALVGKILRGAQPSDLPVERSTKFETVVNLKTAAAIGIELPTAILLRADEVIE